MQQDAPTSPKYLWPGSRPSSRKVNTFKAPARRHIRITKCIDRFAAAIHGLHVRQHPCWVMCCPSLNHPSITQQQQVSLLCTCKETRTAVGQHCSGQVPVHFLWAGTSEPSPDPLEDIQHWLGGQAWCTDRHLVYWGCFGEIEELAEGMQQAVSATRLILVVAVMMQLAHRVVLATCCMLMSACVA